MRLHTIALLASIAALTACNEPPGAAVVGIDPTQPVTSDDLVASILSEAIDPNARDTVSYRYAWFQDGTERSDLSGPSVASALTTKGEAWRVLVTPSDGDLDGSTSEDQVVVLNSPPAASVTLSPALPTSADDIQAVAEGSDADGDTVSFGYAWVVNGSALSWVESTLPAEYTERGLVQLTVTPNDGDEDGEPVVTEIGVDNTTPTVSAVSIVPSQAYEDSTLEAQADVEDADGDELTLSYTWSADGVVVQEGQDATLTGALFDKHQQVVVEVIASDGYEDSEALASEAITILNTVPSISAVALDPSEIHEDSVVSCVPTGWSDADGDAEGYSYAWEVEGYLVGTDATLDGTGFSRGQQVVCTVTPSDGEAEGTALSSAPTTVGNSPPSIASATLSSAAPAEGDTLSVVLGAVEDADGDDVTVSTAWYVSGTLVAITETLSSAAFVRGDNVWAVVTPFDGSDDGAAVTSDTATVVNSVPSVTGVSLSPTELYTDDTVTASVTTTDADGDAVSVSYAWSVDGVTLSTGGSGLAGTTWFDKGQAVLVSITPDDGSDSGAAVSSSAVTVLNSPPGAPVVSIVPAEPDEGDELACVIDSAASDADGDTLSYGFSWTVDGVAFTGTRDTTWPDDTVPAGVPGSGELWVCTATPDDGDDPGTPAQASATITGDRWVGTWDIDDSSAWRTEIIGENANDQFGMTVSGADLNGDGLGDLIVGAPGDDHGKTDGGLVSIYAGPIAEGSWSADDNVTARIYGTDTYSFGWEVFGISDVNSDGFDDLYVARSGMSSGYFFYGPLSGTFDGTTGYDAFMNFGCENPKSIGDFYPGSSSDEWMGGYTVNSSYRGRTKVWSGTTEILTIYGNSSGDYSGRAMDGDVDVNGDGYVDIFVSATGVSSGRGKVYAFYGPTSGTTYTAYADHSLTGAAASDSFGEYIWATSDATGDGYDDLLVAAPGADNNGADSGSIYVFTDPASDSSPSDAAVTIHGAAAGDALSYEVVMGDVDGDGSEDLLLCSPEHDAEGGAWLLYGPLSGTYTLDADEDAAFVGVSADDAAGYDCWILPDTDGDGADDFAIGARYGDGLGVTDHGAVWLFGSP
jgi:hypothetical protein